jgi:hypothetical protein
VILLDRWRASVMPREDAIGASGRQLLGVARVHRHAIRRRFFRLALGGGIFCSAIAAQRLHRAAISLQVDLLGGSRVTFAICSQSIACRRNSSDACIGLLFHTAPDPLTTISHFYPP